MSKTNSKVKKSNNTAVSLRPPKRKSVNSVKATNAVVPLLYRIVYQSKYSLLTTLVLLFSFLVQGVTVTYASEQVSPEVAVSEPVDIVNDASSQTGDVAAPEEAILIEAPNLEPISEVEIESGEIDDSLNSNTEVAVDEVGSSGTVLTEPLFDESAEDFATVTEATGSSSEQLQTDQNNDANLASDNSTSTESTNDNDGLDDLDNDETDGTVDHDPDALDDPPSEVQSTSTNVVIDEITELSTTTEVTVVDLPINITNSDAEFTFNKDECTKLATGSFYCLEANDNILDDALFSAPDADGDLEIFLVRAGVQTQVTNNQTDDAAPFYDSNSDSIVWHRLIDDRYQIITYEIKSGEETILTQSTTNNMEPNRQGDYIVWQRWTDNNWNIVLFDGSEERVITESSAHDIAPYIHGTLIVWNRYSTGNDKTIEMYDMSSQAYVSVNDPEGLSVTNPRMVFVYDSLHPNGDVVTKGYDLISRKFIQLDTLPVELPDEIPESESTGETRALIQSKPTVKTEVEEMVNGTTTPNIGNDIATSTGAVPALDMTLDLSVATSTEAIVSEPVLPQTFDLIIEPLTSTSASLTVQE